MAVAVVSLAAQELSIHTNDCCQLGMNVLESVPGGESLGRMRVDSLASMYWKQGRWAEAEGLFVRAMEIS